MRSDTAPLFANLFFLFYMDLDGSDPLITLIIMGLQENLGIFLGLLMI